MAADSAKKRWRFVFLLNVAQRRVQAEIQSRSDGQTAARAGLLMAVSPERGTSMTEVGHALDLGPSAISNLVERAVRSGLVTRVPDPVDGRAWNLMLTPDGLAMRREAVTASRELNATLCEGFTEAELDVVARWLEAVRTKLGQRDDGGA